MGGLTGHMPYEVSFPLAGPVAVLALERILLGVHSLVTDYLRDPLALVATDRALTGGDVGVRFDHCLVIGQLNGLQLGSVSLPIPNAGPLTIGSSLGHQPIERVVRAAYTLSPLLHLRVCTRVLLLVLNTRLRKFARILLTFVRRVYPLVKC